MTAPGHRDASTRAVSWRRDVALSPLSQRADDRLQLNPTLGERVLDTDRRAGHYDARDDVLAFELAESLGQQPVREPGDRRQQLVEPERPATQCSDHRAAPPPADQLDSVVKARTKARQVAGVRSRVTRLTSCSLAT